EIAHHAATAGSQSRSYLHRSQHSENTTEATLRPVRASVTEEALLADFDLRCSEAGTTDALIQLASRVLGQVTTATVCVLYRYVALSDSLVTESASGDPQDLLHDCTIVL